MNKKLSLMLAAFVAAGYSLTAEAGVVKIANPESGKSYVIAADGLTTLDSNSAIQLLNEDGTVKGSASSTAGSTEEKALWQYVENEDGFTLYSALKDHKGYIFSDDNSSVELMSSVKSTLKYANGYISLDGSSNSLKLEADQVVTFAATGTTKVNFYATTSSIGGETKVEDQVVKFGKKYLVIRPSDDTNTPVLVDESEYNAIAKVAPKNVVWTIGTAGRLNSQMNLTDKQVKITEENGTLKFTLVAGTTGNEGTIIESNSAEGLFGWTNENGEFIQIVQKGTAVKAEKLDEAITEEDKEDFTTISTSQSQDVINAPQLTDYDFISGDIKSASGYLMAFSDGNDDQFVKWDDDAIGYEKAEDADAATAKMDEAYIWSTKKNDDGTYSFVATIDGKSHIMKIEDNTDFGIEGSARGFVLYVTESGTKKYVKWDTNALKATATDKDDAAVFGAYQAASIAYTAEQLIEYQGTSFMLDLTDAQDDKAMNQNPFDGKALVPMKALKDSRGNVYDFTEAEGSEASYLLNIAGTETYIVVDRDQQWTSDQLGAYIADGGYKFITFEKENLIHNMNNDGKQGERDLLYMFSINHIPGQKYIDAGSIADITVTDLDGVDVYYLVSYNSNKNYYLTVNADKQNLVRAAFGTKYAITVATTENNPFNDRYVTIKFAHHKSIKSNSTVSGYSSSVPMNGKVLGMNEAGNYPAPQAADKVRLDAPEGQWIVLATNGAVADDKVAANGKVDNSASVKGTNTQFTFVNRESGQSFTVNRMYWIEGDKYAVEGSYFANAPRDTMIIENANVSKDAYNSTIMEDGAYANYKAADILDQEYNLIVKSTQSDYYVSENHAGQHLLGITEAAEDAVNWQIIPMTGTRILDKDGYLEVPTDTVYNIKHTQYWNNGALYQTTDTLAMISYVLKNTANGEYITYENPQTHDVLSMICDPKSENYLLTAKDADEAMKLVNNDYRFIIKLKPEGKANIIGVNSVHTGGLEYRTIDLTKKLYGATTQKNGAVEVESAYNRVNSNDLFEVAKIDAPQYKLVDRGDTVRIFRAEDEYSVMYENGQFLNLGNIATVKDMAPALYVDTAFVNRTDEFGKNNRYQYLLVVNPKYVPAEPCDIPGHPELHPDTTYGRFLINMIDSAVWANANGAIHNNKFINDTEADETYVKVGFHWGYRTGDALYLTEDNTYSKVLKKIALGNRDFNEAKFAFRYTNAASNDPEGAFKIQTRYISYNDAIKGEGDIYESNEGFLRTVNGVVVVTEGYAKGEEFNLAAEESNPTANETIAAEGAISVTATDGAVVIKGAEGKNVVIATILGKVVANETVNSDNETIAVPAGIAVVSVDGESFKVVVK